MYLIHTHASYLLYSLLVYLLMISHWPRWDLSGSVCILLLSAPPSCLQSVLSRWESPSQLGDFCSLSWRQTLTQHFSLHLGFYSNCLSLGWRKNFSSPLACKVLVSDSAARQSSWWPSLTGQPFETMCPCSLCHVLSYKRSVAFYRNVSSYPRISNDAMTICARVHLPFFWSRTSLKTTGVDGTSLWIDKNSLDDLIQGSVTMRFRLS